MKAVLLAKKVGVSIRVIDRRQFLLLTAIKNNIGLEICPHSF
jgi:hypothetical protein